MPEPTTLRALEGMPEVPAPLADSTLIMVDLQNTYTRGVMELENVQAALDQAAELLDRARSAGTPVIHIMHDGGVGTPYDVKDDIGQIVDRVAPRDGEAVIVKNYPNSFTATDLNERLAAGSNLVLAGRQADMPADQLRRRVAADPFAARVLTEVQQRIEAQPGVDQAEVDIVWDEAWTTDRLSPRAASLLRFLPPPAHVPDRGAFVTARQAARAQALAAPERGDPS